jgi:hypothetical protein
MRLGRDGIAGLIGVAFSLAMLPYAFGLPTLPIVPIGPGFYPALVLTFLAATSALLLVQDFIVQRRTAPGGEEAAVGPKPAYVLVAGAFVLTGAYIALLPFLGFRVATVLYVAAFQLLLERPTSARGWLLLIAVALGTSEVAYVAFEKYLSVLLPRGSLTGW